MSMTLQRRTCFLLLATTTAFQQVASFGFSPGTPFITTPRASRSALTAYLGERDYGYGHQQQNGMQEPFYNGGGGATMHHNHDRSMNGNTNMRDEFHHGGFSPQQDFENAGFSPQQELDDYEFFMQQEQMQQQQQEQMQYEQQQQQQEQMRYEQQQAMQRQQPHYQDQHQQLDQAGMQALLEDTAVILHQNPMVMDLLGPNIQLLGVSSPLSQSPEQHPQNNDTAVFEIRVQGLHQAGTVQVVTTAEAGIVQMGVEADGGQHMEVKLNLHSNNMYMNEFSQDDDIDSAVVDAEIVKDDTN